MIAALVLASSMTASYPYVWSPGKEDLNCDVSDICPHVKPTISRARPSVAYTNKLKSDQLHEHPEIDCSKGCEEDHVISIELCGDTHDPMNLAPEPYEPRPGAHEKDKVENYLHRQVCAGDMSLDEAQLLVRTEWLSVYQSMQKKHGR